MIMISIQRYIYYHYHHTIKRKRDRARKKAKIKARNKAWNLSDHLDIIPEDDEFFSTKGKYRFDFDTKKPLQSNILEVCEDNEHVDGGDTKIIHDLSNEDSKDCYDVFRNL